MNPARDGTKAAAHYALTVAPGETRTVRLRLNDQRPGGVAIRSASTFDEQSTRRTRGRRVLRDGHPADAVRRTPQRVMRQAFAGLLWSKQFYHYVVKTGSTAIPAQPPPPAERQRRPQPRVDAPLQRRRHLDAGQVGVPVVRGVGPRVPLRAAGAGRPRVRQGAADAAAARVVHAPERAAAGLRVGLRRRESAGARLGGAGASTRSSRSAAARATARSSSASSTSCCSTSPGG